MKLRKILSGLKAKYFNGEGKIVSARLLGSDLRVIEGTITREDKDDCWFFHLSSHSKILFDIGANIGKTALIAAVSGKNSRIVLVDPNPKALTYAAKNLLLNDLCANCSFFTGLVTDKVGDRQKFYTVGVGAAGSMYASTAHTASFLNSFFWVNTVTLDFVVDYYQLTPDLVKVDVEGAESLLLEGAGRLASTKRTRFFVEMHSLKELTMEQNASKILLWCNQHGFKAWILKNHDELKSTDQVRHRGRCHLLLQPEEWTYPDFLLGIPEGAPLPTVRH
jgi:FkbM family methyltransferase